ncbi:MAG: hypothetical protein ACLQGP_20320 [Isosphaeraceae bacterium]
MSSERIPSLNELVEVQRAVWEFFDFTTSYSVGMSSQEERALPYIVRIADALRPVRPFVDRIEGWPTKMKRALPNIIEWFDALVRRWGWEGVAQPEPMRSAYLEQSKDWVRENLERPLYEAAVSISDGWNKPTLCPYDDLADEGRKRGIVATMSLDEALSQFNPAKGRLNNEPWIGRCLPVVLHEERQTLVAIFGHFNPCVMEIAPERCARSRLETLSSHQPDTAPSPTGTPEEEYRPRDPAASTIPTTMPGEPPAPGRSVAVNRVNLSRTISTANVFLETLRHHVAMSDVPGYDSTMGRQQVTVAAENVSHALATRDDDPEAAGYRNALSVCMDRLLDNLLADEDFDDTALAGVEKSIAALESLRARGKGNASLGKQEPNAASYPAATDSGTTVTPHGSVIPLTEEAFALELRSLGKPTEAALVEFMTGKKSARGVEVGRNVHDDEAASDKTIRANCNRTNEDAESLGLPYRYRLSSGVVFKTP